MAKNITLILFLSAYNGQPESEYATDREFSVIGAQTNEAPVRYAVRRLAERGNELSRVIALTTPKAAETALPRFEQTLKSEAPAAQLSVVEISDNVTATELLQKTLDALFPINPADSVVVETTGGYRTAINAITLLTRFLKFSDIKVEFSIYADYFANPKFVGDTRETDELFELLDAVNVFAATGNAREIKRLFGRWKLDEKTAFFTAANNFYNSLLVCRTTRIETDIAELKKAIEDLGNADYGVEDAKLLIFRELVLTIVEQKMTFLRGETVLSDFIGWCGENWYLQQAVTFLKESLVKSNPKVNDSQKMLTGLDFNTLRILRNSINHASGKAVCNPGEGISREVVDKVNKLLNEPNEIKGFVSKLLTKIMKRMSP